MLLQITRYADLDERMLMDLYAEGNLENTDYFFPGIKDKAEAVRKVEAGFLGFLQDEFMDRPGNTYWILEENGVWVSALRTTRIRPGLYYIEALETRPDCRRKGFAARLLTGVAETLKKDGPFRLCCCVSKKNTASLKTHLACGFAVVSEAGWDYLLDESDSRDYGMEYRYSGN